MNDFNVTFVIKVYDDITQLSHYLSHVCNA